MWQMNQKNLMRNKIVLWWVQCNKGVLYLFLCIGARKEIISFAARAPRGE